MFVKHLCRQAKNGKRVKTSLQSLNGFLGGERWKCGRPKSYLNFGHQRKNSQFQKCWFFRLIWADPSYSGGIFRSTLEIITSFSELHLELIFELLRAHFLGALPPARSRDWKLLIGRMFRSNRDPNFEEKTVKQNTKNHSKVALNYTVKLLS